MHIYELLYHSNFLLCEYLARQLLVPTRLPRRHRRGVLQFTALGACSPLNFSCTINGLPDKKSKHCNVNVNYKNISYYVLFVFIILTCSIKNIRPL